jgi:hypothetical protein
MPLRGSYSSHGSAMRVAYACRRSLALRVSWQDDDGVLHVRKRAKQPMSIVITYEGCLDDPARLDHLIEAVQQRCRHLQWPCQAVEQHIVGEAYYFLGDQETPGQRPGVSTVSAFFDQKTVDERIRGLFVHPPGTETLTLTFNPAGQLQCYQALPGRPYTTLAGYGMSFTQEPGYYLANSSPWVKTTGEVTSHVLIVALLRFLQSHYMSNVVVHDPTGFWDTLDITALTQEHMRMQTLIDLFQESDLVKDLLQLVGITDIAMLTRVPRGDELN